MAIVSEKVDDLDGRTREGVTTVKFGIGTDLFEIDLSPKNMKRFRREVEPFTGAGRRLSPFNGTTRRGGHTRTGLRELNGGPRRGRAGREDSTAARAWCREQGFEVSARGRMPVLAERAWEAHKDSLNGSEAL
jgi:hypothetical protein